MKILIVGDENNFKKSKLYKTLVPKKKKNNIEITKIYDNSCKIGIKWFCNELVTPVDEKLCKTEIKIINKDFQSQDRYFLEKFHIKAFGYGINIDPLTYKGKIFRKGRSHKFKFLNIPENLDNDYHNKNNDTFYFKEKNGVRYMTFMGPIDKRDVNSVYQKNIDRKIGKNKYQDYRLTVIDRKPFILLDTVHEDFVAHSIKKKKIIAIKPSVFFKKKDLESIEKYINLINLDYGDLDLIVDKNDNDKIYVIDVNNGPMNGGSTPKHWYKDCWDEYINQINKMLLIE